MSKAYHCISFVLQPLGLFYVVFHRMLSELGTGRGETEKKGRIISNFTFISKECYESKYPVSVSLLQPYQTLYDSN